MQLGQRIRRLEQMNEIDVTKLSDEELERVAGPTHPAVDRWMSGLTDAELETLSTGGPGMSAILATAPKEFFGREICS